MSMPVPADPRALEGLVEDALARARIARSALLDEIVPHLRPEDRSFAQYVVRHLDEDRLFSHAVRQDLGTLIALVGRNIDHGTATAFVADAAPECLSAGAVWSETRRTAEAGALAVAVVDLRDLARALDRVQDRLAADRIAAKF